MRHRAIGEERYLPLVMLVNPLVLAIGRRWRRRACPCCGWQGFEFLWAANGPVLSRNSVCPHCESRSRHRAITLLLTDDALPGGVNSVLHFAPEPLLLHVLRERLGAGRYRTTDLLRSDVDLPGEDIQHLTLPDGGEDLVICNHVLEHVVDDERAIAELARVTSPGGTVVVTVPGDWDGRSTAAFAAPDPNGHHRHYGLDFREQLARSFGSVRVVDGDDLGSTPNRYGIRTAEPIFLCQP